METKVLLIDNSGYPYKWVDFEKAAYYMAKGLVAWVPTEVSFVLNGGINASTGRVSQMKIPSIMAIRNAKADTQRVSERRRNSKMLFKRDGHTCAYCGYTFHDSKLTVDHIIPSSRGGSDKWNNLISSCSPCNNRKKDRTPEEAKMPLKFKAYSPSKAQFLNFSQNSKLECQAEWLAKFL